jgi:hypothetical protein
MPKAIPIEEEIGKRYGRLTVVAFSRYRTRGKDRDRIFTCKCECGSNKEFDITRLRSGKTKSCGCFQRDMASAANTTHGLSRWCSEYKTWTMMKNRCLNPKNDVWDSYGGRGITIFKDWADDFAIFLAHVGVKPTPKHSLDRINNDGNYEPGNVRWATQKEQNSNKKNNRLLTLDGVSKTISQWARELNVSKTCLRYRLDVMKLGDKAALLYRKSGRACRESK